jgi:hypothetical protein
MTTAIPQWGIFELSLKGESFGNPFIDVSFDAQFRQGEHRVNVGVFYDGEGVYRLERVMNYKQ